MATGAGDAGNIVSVTGGALEVLFGSSANFTKVRQEFSHPRNHLSGSLGGVAPIGTHFQKSLAISFGTRYPGPRRTQLERCHAADLAGRGKAGAVGIDSRERAEGIAVRSGGVYDSEQLHVREAMLQQLESSIQLMHQELETLLREVLIRQAEEEET